MRSALAIGKSKRAMKTKSATTKLVSVLCCAIAIVTQAQTVRTWTGLADGVRLDLAANWDPNDAVPQPNDTMRWDGLTTSNLFLTFTTTALQGAYGQNGRDIYLTSNQTNSVTIYGSVGLAAAIRANGITVEEGAGSLILGSEGTNSSDVLDMLWGGVTSQTHTWVNNSTNPVILKPNIRFRYGGGGAHTIVFDGSGDWIVNHHLRADNNSPTVVTKSGSGRLVWTRIDLPVVHFDSPIGSPVTINEGSIILKSGNCIDSQNINNNGLLEFDAPGQSGILFGVISGTGNLKVSNGTLTLSGQNTFSGNIELAGGTLVLGSAETEGVSGPLGVGGTISFSSGTLKYSSANTYDYSPRFSTASGQQYKIDTGGQVVTLTSPLSSVGGTLTKKGSGSLILAGSCSYGGLTTVEEGKLVFGGPKTGTGSITVLDGAGLGITATGTQVTPAVLTLGSSSGCTLEFNGISSTTTAPLAATTLSSAGTITVNVNSGTFVVGQSYPLLTWVNGSAPNAVIGSLSGLQGTLSVVGNTLYLNVSALDYVWSGANNGNWDTTTPNNWTYGGSPATFVNGGSVLFSDAAIGTTSVVINEVVQPSSVTVNNVEKDYTITSSATGYIAGTGGLRKAGSGTLTLSGGYNAYTGATLIEGGIVSISSLANGGLPSDIGAASSDAANLTLNGGTLAYTGVGANIDRLFTLGPGGGTIEASGTGALALNNTGALGQTGVGGRVLTLNGSSLENNTLAAAINDAGSGSPTSVSKRGDGKWILTGTNTYSGGTTIAGGILQIGAGGYGGTLGTGNVANNGRLVFNRDGTLVVPGTISGTGYLENDGPGVLVLAANNTYTGGTTNNGTLQIGAGGPTGELNSTSPIENNGLLIYDSTHLWSLVGNGIITGTGNLIVRSGHLMAIGANSYTGWTLIESGATFQPCRGNTGQLLSSVITNNGTLRLVRQDGIWPDVPVFGYSNNIVGTGRVVKDVNNFNDGSVMLLGTNTYTGGTFIAGGGIVLGDGSTPGAGSIIGDVTFIDSEEYNDTRRYLVFNRPDDVIFSGNISSTVSGSIAVGNRGQVIQAGVGVLTLTGNNTYPGGTTINAGSTLQVGNGGTTGSIGSGNVVNDGTLVFNRADNITFGGTITGSGSLVKEGAGVLTLTASNSYYGYTTVSNGTLLVNGDNWASYTFVYGTSTFGGTGPVNGGQVYLDPGTTLAPGPTIGSVGTLTINNDLIFAGDIAIEIDKALSPSNDMIVVTGQVVNNGTGTVRVVNLGPTLAVGDKFTLFSQPVLNGDKLTITGGNATWINNLAVDGSITVATVIGPPTTPTNISYSISAGKITLSWPASHIGWILQVQTNALNVGISTNWVDVAGSASTNVVQLPIDTTQGTIFFRLRYP